MNMLWWTKVTNASHFLKEIVETIQSGQSVLLYLPTARPWYHTMRSIIEKELIQQNATRQYQYIVDTGKEPGEYLFYTFCKKEKQAHYRPNISYAEFLAKNDDIVLKDRILWITEVSAKQLNKWISFIESYYKALEKKNGCIFLIETREKETSNREKKGIKKIRYSKKIEHYDNYVFNMLAVSSLKEKEIFKQYLAETVSILFPEDIELSALCIRYGRTFLENPVEVLKKVLETEQRSDGSKFEFDISDNELQEHLWEAQIKTIFPLIEKHRSTFVQKYKKEIESLLPIRTNYGEEIKEVNEVELGTISYLASSGQIKMTYEDFSKLSILKSCRNTLAHIHILSQQEIDHLLS